ncbi:MAG: DNA repair protein RecN [Nitrospinota bacterium]
MLARLSIRNIAIIESVEIEFGEGLNIITGETGAGKSILITSVGLILGNRITDPILRTGAQTGFIEAVFILSDISFVESTLENAGIELEPELIIKRTFSETGKNRHFVNGCSVSLSFLKELGSRLVDIHGQYDHQTLLHPENQLNVLDEYAKTTSFRTLMQEKYVALHDIGVEIEKISSAEKERAERAEFLKFQKNEIDEAGLTGVDEEALKKRQELLKSAEARSSLAGAAYQALYGEEGACLEKLATVLAALEEIEKHDSTLHGKTEELRAAFFAIEDISRFLREYFDQVTCLPEELMEIENKTSTLQSLKRKYGHSVEDILLKRDEIGAELDALGSAAGRKEALEKQCATPKKEIEEISTSLAEKREKAARHFKKEVERELRELKMGKVIFDVVFAYKEDPGSFVRLNGKPVFIHSKGIGQMGFFFSPNEGEENRPLSKIASGGELSRVMLALKKVLAEKDKTPVLIFDEIDTGISGGTAEIVGRKIKEVASCHQVFCITHLPQIASRGKNHFLIRKDVIDGKTKTRTDEISGQERVQEIARMAGGVEITDTTLKHAREMITRGAAGSS